VGETTFQTSSKKLAWLNGMKARHEGEYNPVAGENDFRVYGKGSLSLRTMRALKLDPLTPPLIIEVKAVALTFPGC
jgi:hypothetical protein